MIEDELMRQQIDVIEIMPETYKFDVRELKYLYHGNRQNYKLVSRMLSVIKSDLLFDNDIL